MRKEKLYVIAQPQRSGDKLAAGHRYRAAAGCGAGIDRCLDRSGAKRFAVASSAEIQNIRVYFNRPLCGNGDKLIVVSRAQKVKGIPREIFSRPYFVSELKTLALRNKKYQKNLIKRLTKGENSAIFLVCF